MAAAPLLKMRQLMLGPEAHPAAALVSASKARSIENAQNSPACWAGVPTMVAEG